jgi:diguanylate cyclase (GGDEF)-like protein
VAAMLERWSPGAHGAVAIVDEELHQLRFIAAPQLSAAALEAIQGMSVALGRPPGHGEFVVAPVDADPYYAREGAMLRASGYQTFWAGLVTDVEGGQRALGAVVLLRCDEVTPDDSDRRRLTLGANLAALAVERDRTQGRLAHQASHDPLTGLPNRETVLDRLRRMVDRPHHDGPGAAVLFLDIDRFKVFNDSVGHEAGDRLLVELGERLREALRPGDLVARFGGDEFVMVCERVGGELDAYMLATRIIELVQAPFTIGGNEVVVTASIGIAMVNGGEPESLLRDADAAMYWAKDRGRARAELFDDELRRRVVLRLDIERELRHALEREELELHFQPVVSLETCRLTGFEALLRWRHPTRGLRGPDDFLEVAEETGLARPIGAWVRDAACTQAVRWHSEHPEWGGFVMGVNLTGVELYEHDLVAGIERTISSTGIDPVSLAFEISERYIAKDTTLARGLLLRLRELGVHLALDDFGTGAAALVHLRALPVTSIKIDRSFVRGLGIHRSDDAIVEAVVDLTRRLDLITVAEGVETATQELRLREAGCCFAQGHRFAAALPPDEVETCLKQRGGRIAVAASRVDV